MSTPENQTPASPASNGDNVTTPAAAPITTAPVVTSPTAPVAVAPVAAAPKPKLNLNLTPRDTGTNLNTFASSQKVPDRKYAAAIEEDDQPSIIITLIAAIAAAAAITFAVLLFLKTK